MSEQCHYIHFGLIVTGKSEREHIPKLFKSLWATGICSFKVIGFTGQRSAITSKKRKLKMVGTGKTIPDRDTNEIGLPARRYLNANACSFVILIDDLEHDRREQAQAIFDRYRLAFDTILNDTQKSRASVHFLVNMLEAYYFADSQAINNALNLNPQLDDYDGDVETISNPKSELKKLYPGFNEIEDGGKILEIIDIERVLSHADRCAWLRTLFAWCVKAMKRCPHSGTSSMAARYHLHDGTISDITKPQLDNL